MGADALLICTAIRGRWQDIAAPLMKRGNSLGSVGLLEQSSVYNIDMNRMLSLNVRPEEGTEEEVGEFPTIAIIFLGYISLLYFVPSMVAFGRRHHQAVNVFLINLFLGCTGIGWVVVLIWALAGRTREPDESI